jgi:TolB-like protein/Flp pilus assembly protein TadD
VLVVLVGLGGVALRYLTSPSLAPITGPANKAAALPMPDKPSIAVLPFTNMSGDPEQEYFSDGMSEDLITDLSKISGLFVIARNSTFAYKGRAVKPQQVSQELGVRYLLEGSIQKDATRVRINSQLVDATMGHHLWAERYDRELKDLFALQDEIREKIVLALKVTLTPEEQARFRRAPTANLEAYDALLRGEASLRRATREASIQARQMFERAIELDPQYAVAYAALSMAQLVDLLLWDPFRTSLDQIFVLAQRAVALDDSLAIPHSVLGAVYLWKKQHEQAIAEAQRAVTLDPNYAGGYDTLAEVLSYAGRPEEALGLMETAMRLDPAYPAHYLLTVGQASFLTGRYEEAIVVSKKALARNPNLFFAYELLALSYGELGREEEARAAVAALRKIQPYAALDGAKLGLPYKDPALVERHLALLQRAGMQWHWPTDNLEALGALWSGLRDVFGTHRTKESNAQARQRFERAIELDPQYAAAHALLGLTYFLEWVWQWSPDPQTLERAFALAQKAVALDDSLPLTHGILGHVYLWKKEYAQAIAAAERAVALAPTDADGYQMLAEVLNFAGQPDKALRLVEQAMRLNPQYRDTYLVELGLTYQFLGRYEEAVATLQKAGVHAPDNPGIRLMLAVSYSELGREAEARAEAAELLRINPDYSLAVDRQRSPFKDPAVAERFFAALRKAGLK